jgi:hypothetical protein
MALATNVKRPRPPAAISRGPLGGGGPSGALEFVLASLALVVLGLLVYAPHLRHGGFYADDWSNGALALYSPGGDGGAISDFAHLTLYRPVLVLYVPLTYFVFGTHMAYQLAWATALAMFASAMLYGVLRTVGVPTIHSWMIAALVLVYPWSDSTRLWATADQATLSIGLTLAGLWLALEGLKRRSWVMHAGAAGLYLTSILTYELTLPLIAAAGLLYVAKSDWSTAKARWGVDLLVVLVGGSWVGTHTAREKLGLSADLSHLKEIVIGGGTILGRSAIPVGEPRTTIALIALLVVLVAGVATWWRSRARAQVDGWGLKNWLLVAASGLVVGALGWVMFIPANPYYTPSIYGITNRVNALAGFGLVIAVYGATGVAVATVRLVSPVKPTPVVATIGVFTLGLALGFGYVRVLERHIRIWNTAFRAEEAGLRQMRKQFPRLPPGTTVFTSNYPAYQTLGVPIFSTNWDVNGMIKLQYKDGSLSAYPILPGQRLVCDPTGVAVEGPGAPSALVFYGSVRFLDVQTGQHAQPGGKKACQASAGQYTAGPLYIWLSY